MHVSLYSIRHCTYPVAPPSSPPPTLCILHFTVRHCTYPLTPLSPPPTLCILRLTLSHCTYPETPPPLSAHPSFPTTYFVRIPLYYTSLCIPCSAPLFPTSYFVNTSLYTTSLYIPCTTPPLPYHLVCAYITLLYVTVHTL